MNSLIEKVTISELFPTMAAKDWAHITNQAPDYHSRSFYYREKGSGAEFQEIVGGFVPPAEKVGYALVLGLGRQDDPRIDPAWRLGSKQITCLAEAQAEGLPELMTKALELRKSYAPALDKGFYCDYDEALHFRIGQIMARLEGEAPFVLLPGINFDQPTAFRDYVATLSLYRRILDRGKCKLLRAAMDHFPKEALRATDKRSWEGFPEVTALAYAVSGLMVNPLIDLGDGAIEDESEAA